MKRPSPFKTLKAGCVVKDTWYGSGTVLKLTKTTATIQLVGYETPWKYDRAHVNAFITLDKAKRRGRCAA